MAARILHRLRHALGAEGAREERAHDGGEAEDCPESSELEDDTEGLSTRLSGTLSFASHEDEDGDEDEEDGAGEEPGEPTEPTGEAAGTEDGGRCRDAEPRGEAVSRGQDGAGRPGAPAEPLSPRRVGRGGEAPRRQPADPPAAGAVEEVAEQPRTTAAALRGHQRQRG